MDSLRSSSLNQDTTTAASLSHNARQLIVPSADVPWSVEVISTMPKELIGKLSEYDTGAVTSDGPSWVCLGLSPEGKFFAYPQDAVVAPSSRRVTTTSNTTTRTTTTTAPQKSDDNINTIMDDDWMLLPPKYVGHLYHPKLKSLLSDVDHHEHHHPIPCLVALERRDHQVVQVYALHPMTGQLFAKKLTPLQVRTSIVMPFTGYARMEVRPREVFTCLQTLPSAAGLLVAGTSLGRLWLVKCTAVPMALHVYPLEYTMDHDNNASSSYSLLGRIFGTTPSKKKMKLEDNNGSSSGRVQVILPLPSTGATTTSSSSSSSNSVLTNTATTTYAPARFWMVTQGGFIVAFEPSNHIMEASSSPSTATSLPWNYSSHAVGRLGDAFPQTDATSHSRLQVLHAAIDPTPLHDPQDKSSGGSTKVVAHFLVQTQGRLFWMTTTTPLSNMSSTSNGNFQVIRLHWLNRFPDDATIHVEGLVVAENRMAYAAMSPSAGNSGPILIMALDATKLPLITANSKVDDDGEDDDAAIYEVDLPMTQVPSLLPHTLTLDRVTHGCTLLATSGIGLRIRCQPPTTTRSRQQLSTPLNVQSNTAVAPQTDQVSSSSGIQSSKLLTLTSHLRSAFWHAYQHYEGAVGAGASAAVSMPPSLEQASASYLEAAVVSVGQQLQQQPGDAAAASSQNPLEWHLAYINFLQQGGLYRKLSRATRYKLMGMGQEVTVFSHLLQQTNQQQDILTSRLQPTDIASWFYNIAQKHQFLKNSSGSKEQHDARVLWCVWFCLALKVATDFRQERAIPFYDVPVEPDVWIRSTRLAAAVDGTQYLWTSQRLLQSSMVDLLQFLRKSQVSMVLAGLIETIVQAVLQSHVDTSFSATDQERYAKVKSLAIPLLRKMVGRDDLAFELSIDHCYFEGLCQIAKDHEKQHDEKNFTLDAALFSKLQDCVDTTTGLAFGPFCLQWHAERGLYGHVLNYGHHGCPKPDDLRHLLQRDERLRPYRWIQAIRQGDYHAATDHLITDSKDPNVSFSDLTLSLSLAKLANLVVENDAITQRSSTAERSRFIDSMQERVNAQLLLLKDHPYIVKNEPANTNPAAPFHLRSPEELLSWAIDDKVGQFKDQSDRLQYCLLGLAICLTMDDKVGSNGDESEMALGAARLWAKAILLESPLWREWIQTQPDLTDPELTGLIMDSTLFGRLLKHSWRDREMKRVTFGPSLERNVLALLKWDYVATTEMQRLLQHVCRQGRKRQ